MATMLKARFPEAHISLAVADFCAPIARLCPDIDTLQVLKLGNWLRKQNTTLADLSIAGTMRLHRYLSRFKRLRFDIVMDLHATPLSREIVNCSHAEHSLSLTTTLKQLRRSRMIGTEDARPKKSRTIHYCEGLTALCKIVGAQERFVFNIVVPESLLRRARRRLRRLCPSGKDILIGICPFSRHATKNWPLEKFAELVCRLHQLPRVHCVICGSHRDVERLRQLSVSVDSLCRPSVAPTADLKDLAALQTMLEAFVSVDTGPMHLASALDIPVVVLFGPTDPRWKGPYGRGPKVVIGGEARDPFLKNITVERVFQATLDIMDIANRG